MQVLSVVDDLSSEEAFSRCRTISQAQSVYSGGRCFAHLISAALRHFGGGEMSHALCVTKSRTTP